MPTQQGDSQGFHVRPDELRAAANVAQSTAAQLLHELQGLTTPAEQAGQVLQGCRIGEAVRTCVQAWQELLTGLAGTLDQAGRGLVESADGYHLTDAEAAANFASAQAR